MRDIRILEESDPPRDDTEMPWPSQSRLVVSGGVDDENRRCHRWRY